MTRRWQAQLRQEVLRKDQSGDTDGEESEDDTDEDSDRPFLSPYGEGSTGPQFAYGPEDYARQVVPSPRGIILIGSCVAQTKENKVETISQVLFMPRSKKKKKKKKKKPEESWDDWGEDMSQL